MEFFFRFSNGQSGSDNKRSYNNNKSQKPYQHMTNALMHIIHWNVECISLFSISHIFLWVNSVIHESYTHIIAKSIKNKNRKSRKKCLISYFGKSFFLQYSNKIIFPHFQCEIENWKGKCFFSKRNRKKNYVKRNTHKKTLQNKIENITQ